jgi:hypothetical protein
MRVAELIGTGHGDQGGCCSARDGSKCVDDEVTSGLIQRGQKHFLLVEGTESPSGTARESQVYVLKNCRIASDVGRRVWTIQIDPNNQAASLTRLYSDQRSACRDCEIEIVYRECWWKRVGGRLICVNVDTPDDQH